MESVVGWVRVACHKRQARSKWPDSSIGSPADDRMRTAGDASLPLPDRPLVSHARSSTRQARPRASGIATPRARNPSAAVAPAVLGARAGRRIVDKVGLPGRAVPGWGIEEGRRSSPRAAWPARGSRLCRGGGVRHRCTSRVSDSVSGAARCATAFFSMEANSWRGPVVPDGCRHKTMHLLPLVDPVDDTYRRLMNRQLTVQEPRHRLARAICHGGRGQIRHAYREGQEDQLAALGLSSTPPSCGTPAT